MTLVFLLHALTVAEPTVALEGRPAHTMEAGATLGVSRADGLTQTEAGAHVGYYFARNLELTLLGGVQYAHELCGTLLAEPSVHLPLARWIDGFAGLGGGLGVSPEGLGFALQQRVGADLTMGRAGTITAAVDLLYASNRAETTSLGGSLGYGLTW